MGVLDETVADGRRSVNGDGPPRWFLVFLPVLLALHVALVFLQPAPRLMGDEVHYAEFARADAAAGRRLPLPGTLRFDHRPELGSRVLALLGGPDTDPAKYPDALRRRAGLLQALLLVGLVGATWALGRAVGLGPAAAAVGATVLGLFPWVGFHVHSLWPELLHGLLFGLALLGLVRHLRGGGPWPLAGAGIATGFALLAKGALGPLVPAWFLFLALAAVVRGRPGGSRAVARQLAPLALFAGTIALVVVPQWVANARAGHGARLAANRWWNLELGLTISMDASDPAVLDERGRWLPKDRVNATYLGASESIARREELAEDRTRNAVGAAVAERGALGFAFGQLEKLATLLLARPDGIPHRLSTFDQALGHRHRWGESPPAWIAWLAGPGRLAWMALLLLGLAGLGGLAGGPRRNAGALLVAATALYFFVAGAAVPVKVRFLLPVVPLLCLGVGASLELVRERLRSDQPAGGDA